MRNRIIWHFEHGLHCKRRFSGRYETIIWFTKSDEYIFHLDAVRVPQKYPGKKYYKGPKVGQYSCHPLGKNPGDLWVIPNVKNNHVEKTEHPCQFPVELIERLVLALTNEDDWVLDPFVGVGTTIIAAIRHGRRGAGAEIVPKYVALARTRIQQQLAGTLRTRPMDRPIYDPTENPSSIAISPGKNEPPKSRCLIVPLVLSAACSMKIVETYSHLNGLEFLLVHKPALWEEIRDVIAQVHAETCRTKLSREKTKKGKILYSPIEMNKAFKNLFRSRSWQESRVSYWVTRSEKLIRKTYTLSPDQQRQAILAAGEEPIFSYNKPISSKTALL
jgi:hypothetical protein